MPKIIYIMGTGRSGTTILDMMISNNPNILGAGEVTHMIDPDVLLGETCACGKSVPQCNAWRGVCDEFLPDELHEAKSLVRNLEAHSHFFMVAFNLIGKKKLARYRHINNRLFSSLCDGMVDNVVDSSKYAGRALLLSRLFPDNIQVICITRSAEGIIGAFKKKDMEQPSKSISAIFIYYIYTLVCFYICRIILKKNIISIRYEKMADNPVAIVSQIAREGTISLARSKRILENNEHLDVGHIVIGNRLRKKGKVKFRKSHQKEMLHGIDRKFAAVMNRSRSVLGF